MTKERPVKDLRLGAVRAAIWRNEFEDGRARHSVSFSRLYKDEGVWRDATSFGRADLPLVAKVADMAHTWIYQQSGEQPEASEEQLPHPSFPDLE